MLSRCSSRSHGHRVLTPTSPTTAATEQAQDTSCIEWQHEKSVLVTLDGKNISLASRCTQGVFIARTQHLPAALDGEVFVTATSGPQHIAAISAICIHDPVALSESPVSHCPCLYASVLHSNNEPRTLPRVNFILPSISSWGT